MTRADGRQSEKGSEKKATDMGSLAAQLACPRPPVPLLLLGRLARRFFAHRFQQFPMVWNATLFASRSRLHFVMATGPCASLPRC